ncbi:RNA polymerase subunit sigma [Inquilinus sp. KBS0705]|nr:RNA polymerase subunit sigma [Inquilinus sp. KBS0705]
MEQQELIPHLFRTESRKLTAVLCKLFGIENVSIAEDVVSETFLAALESWPYKGIPENPVAWLYTVAKNKAKNLISRGHLFNDKIKPQVEAGTALGEEFEIDLSPKNIADSQLQMLFAICHPAIPAEAQIGLALCILCGFGIDEIANAFLSNKETINKRLFRAKEKLRTERVAIAFPPEAEIGNRLQAVLTTLYLLFNEGYYSESRDTILRNDLCLEAMRLTYMLIEYPPTNQPDVNALLALMCFHASRFEARKDANGAVILYNDQDESLWNQELIAKGAYYLNEASTGNKLSKYHIEAGIAYWHTIKEDTTEKWEGILHLFNQLLMIEYSPVAALNRTYALSKVRGNRIAIIAAEKLNLSNNHFYYTLLGELYKTIDPQEAQSNLLKALHLAKTQADKQLIRRKIEELENL